MVRDDVCAPCCLTRRQFLPHCFVDRRSWSEIAFFFGVINVALTAFIIGRCPSQYYVFWTVKSVLLFTWRYISYRRSRSSG